jgi:excisionase family DNA binding protein
MSKEILNWSEPVLIRPAHAARMLSVSRSTVYELIASGQLPSVKVGDRMIRVPIAAILRMAQPPTDEGAG